jgi:hypothetical protein
LIVLLVLFAASGTAPAATIFYTISDLSDTTPGEDLWRYEYAVSGRDFLASEFFDIYFDPNLYGTLTAGPAPSADWDVAILQQPNPANFPPFDRGMFDAFALTGGPSLSGTFSVDFVYLGSGIPGRQPFEIFSADADLVERGFTALIPEPATTALCLLGLLLTIGLHRRSQLQR